MWFSNLLFTINIFLYTAHPLTASYRDQRGNLYFYASERINDQAFVLGPVTGTSLILHIMSHEYVFSAKLVNIPI